MEIRNHSIFQNTNMYTFLRMLTNWMIPNDAFGPSYLRMNQVKLGKTAFKKFELIWSYIDIN